MLWQHGSVFLGTALTTSSLPSARPKITLSLAGLKNKHSHSEPPPMLLLTDTQPAQPQQESAGGVIQNRQKGSLPPPTSSQKLSHTLT